MQRDNAETLARDVLVWLAGNEDLLRVFMDSTGGDVAAVRKGMDDPYFLAAVLDFLMMDDAWVVSYCDANALAYDQPARARAALPGGGEMHWT